METKQEKPNQELVKVEQTGMSLQVYSQASLVKEGKKTFISKYQGKLTPDFIAICSVKITKAFPQLPIGFYDVFTDRLIEKGFCDERLQDAVNHVIDTCIYPVPTIANFLGYDDRTQLFAYHEMEKLVREFGGGVWKSYDKTKVGDVLFWYKKTV